MAKYISPAVVLGSVVVGPDVAVGPMRTSKQVQLNRILMCNNCLILSMFIEFVSYIEIIRRRLQQGTFCTECNYEKTSHQLWCLALSLLVQRLWWVL